MLNPMRAPARYFTIGEAGRLCGLTPRALRLYEDKGLIRPTRRDGIRLYTDEDLEALRHIGAGRRAGLALSDIRELLAVVRSRVPAGERARMLDICRGRMALLEAQQRELERLTAAMFGPNDQAALHVHLVEEPAVPR